MIEPLLLLLVANGMPILGYRLLGKRLDWPVDAELRWSDGRRVFGASKSWRGIVLAFAGTAAAAAVLGLDWRLGAAFGGAAMIGDLVSSFVKRRLGSRPSESVLFLDQLPEALLPLVLLRDHFGLGLVDVFAVTFVWFWLDLGLSLALYKIGIRKRPR